MQINLFRNPIEEEPLNFDEIQCYFLTASSYILHETFVPDKKALQTLMSLSDFYMV